MSTASQGSLIVTSWQDEFDPAAFIQLARFGFNHPAINHDNLEAEKARELREIAMDLNECLSELAAYSTDRDAADNPEVDALKSRASSLNEAQIAIASATCKADLVAAKSAVRQMVGARNTDSIISDAKSSTFTRSSDDKSDHYSEAYTQKTKQFDKEWTDFHRRETTSYSDIRSFADKHGVKGMEVFDEKRRELEAKRDQTKDRIEKSIISVDIARNGLSASDHVVDDLKRRKAAGENIADDTIAEAERKQATAKKLVDEAIERSRQEIKAREEELDRKSKDLQNQVGRATTPEEKAKLADSQKQLDIARAHIAQQTATLTQKAQLATTANYEQNTLEIGEAIIRRDAQKAAGAVTTATLSLEMEDSDLPTTDTAPNRSNAFAKANPSAAQAVKAAELTKSVKGGEDLKNDAAAEEKAPNPEVKVADAQKDKGTARTA